MINPSHGCAKPLGHAATQPLCIRSTDGISDAPSCQGVLNGVLMGGRNSDELKEKGPGLSYFGFLETTKCDMLNKNYIKLGR